jgi:hypothetical protein
MDEAVRQGILATADALGMDPVVLATIMSYETGGTLDPLQKGGVTKWGRHRGLIQFGEPQAKQYGVNWDDPINSQLGPQGAVYKYMTDRGWKPGMSELDAYSIVNAGGPGKYNAVDSGSTVRQKVETQFGPHRKKVVSLLGDIPGRDMSLEGRDERYANRAAYKPDVSLEGRTERSSEAGHYDSPIGPQQPAKPDPKKGWLDVAGDLFGGFAKGFGAAQTQGARGTFAPVSTTMTQAPMSAPFDANAAELQRQQLAQALARLNSGQLWG